MAQNSTNPTSEQNPPDSQPYRYKAFISYSHKDELRAARLHRRLERYRIPKTLRQNEAGIGLIFRDKAELSVASVLDASIEAALRESESLIVLCSPFAVKSKWVDKEIDYFKSLGRGDRIFTVLLSGIPNAQKRGFLPVEECLPQALRYDVSQDGVTRTERADPLATDLRAGGDGNKLGLLKLVSGLLDIRLDQLLQRQLIHTRRRMLGVLVGSSLIISFLDWRSQLNRLLATRRRDAKGENKYWDEILPGVIPETQYPRN